MFEEESLILDTKEKVQEWLDSMKIKKYTINDDLTVDVDEDVDLNGQDFEKIPVKFGRVGRNFWCYRCLNLVSLEGAPRKVNGSFYCNDCPSLVSLEGAPKEVGRSFYCNYCLNLVSLECAPIKVGGSFYCNDCINLVSLEGFPLEINRINCKNTPFENLFTDTNVHGFAKMNEQEKENFIIEAYKENRIDERIFKANVSKEKQIAYKGLVSGKKFRV